MNIPLSRPNIGPEEITAVMEVLTSNWLAPGGEYNEKFEKIFAELIKVTSRHSYQFLYLGFGGGAERIRSSR